MNTLAEAVDPRQQDLFETAACRALLDQLLSESRLYRTSQDYQDLLDFSAHLRNFAPFNAMLLQVQKPGLRFAASAYDWRERFGRRPKEDARPLLILWPFGPVALVYDVVDTEGDELPEDVASFVARGEIDDIKLHTFIPLLERKNIQWTWVDQGDRNAGSIRVIRRASTDGEANTYRIHINRNHDAPIQFATLAHELGHLLLGHVGPDKKLSVPRRARLTHEQEELEAESVAYLVCKRNGVESKSQTYLSSYVTQRTTTEEVDIYQVMRAAGQIESILKLTSHTKFEPATKRPRGGRDREVQRAEG